MRAPGIVVAAIASAAANGPWLRYFLGQDAAPPMHLASPAQPRNALCRHSSPSPWAWAQAASEDASEVVRDCDLVIPASVTGRLQTELCRLICRAGAYAAALTGRASAAAVALRAAGADFLERHPQYRPTERDAVPVLLALVGWAAVAPASCYLCFGLLGRVPLLAARALLAAMSVPCSICRRCSKLPLCLARCAAQAAFSVPCSVRRRCSTLPLRLARWVAQALVSAPRSARRRAKTLPAATAATRIAAAGG